MADEDEPQRFTIDTVEKLDAWTGDIDKWNAWRARSRGDSVVALDPKRAVHPVLQGDAAMALWRKGRNEWNAWVQRNPRADVEFRDQKFGAATASSTDGAHIDFSRFKFPDGDVSFQHLYYDEAVGEYYIRGSNFGEGFVDFSNSDFGSGTVDFSHAVFGADSVDFSYACFGPGNVAFRGVNFGDDRLSFRGAIFGKGDIDFTRAEFGDGDIIFDDAVLSDGDADFRWTSYGKGSASFANTTFAGLARFTNLRGVADTSVFSFDGCSFGRLFTFSCDGRLGGPIDLRRTSLKHDVVVQDIQCGFELEARPNWRSILKSYGTGMPHGAEPNSPWIGRAMDPEDSQRFRKLKELAVGNRNHAKALEFHAQEIRSQRGHGTTKLQDFAQFLYWVASDYGRSVKRPFVWLIALWFSFAGLYWQSRTAFSEFPAKALSEVIGLTRDFGTVLGYSGSNMLAFIPTGGTARQQGIELLYGGQVPDWVLLMAGVQSILAVILLFLLGLGLRNMFRV